MTRLSRVELKRLLARRVTWMALLGAALLAGLVLLGVHEQVRYLTPADRAQATADFRSAHQSWVKNHEQDERSCRAALPESDRDSATADDICERPEPTLADFLAGPLGLDGLYRDAVSVLVPMAVFVTFLLGASLVAAEFSTRSMTTWLTFEPRRGRVAAAKLIAVVIGSAAIGIVMVVIAGVGVWLIGAGVGLTDQLGTSARTEILSLLSRLPVVAAVSGLLSGALAFVLRHTSAVLGVLIAYAVAAEGVIRGVLPEWQPWLGSTNAMAFLKGRQTYEIYSCGPSGCHSRAEVVGFAQGTSFLLVLTVLVTAAGVLSFRHRDVT